MNQPTREETIARRLERAWETIAEAELLVEHEHWNAAVNRLYYAVFYAANAYLAANDSSAKTHKGTRMAFGTLINGNQAIPEEVVKVYHDLFEERHQADYDFFMDMEKDLVLPLFEPSRAFIRAVEQAIPRS